MLNSEKSTTLVEEAPEKEAPEQATLITFILKMRVKTARMIKVKTESGCTQGVVLSGVSGWRGCRQ